MISDATRALIREEARKAYPNECCGYVIRNSAGEEELHPCINAHERPKEHFKIEEFDTVAAIGKGDIVCVYHSHPDWPTAEPSPLDRSCCFAMDIPWVIVAYPSGDYRELQPDEYVPEYTGREFFFGVQDCYTLLRDWYRKERNIVLTNYERKDGFWKRGENLYLDNFAREGFRDVSNDPAINLGDVFLHCIKSPPMLPNHASIYLGNGQILHHVYGRLSVVEPLTGMWAKTIHSRYRHRSL